VTNSFDLLEHVSAHVAPVVETLCGQPETLANQLLTTAIWQ
jgi:hypothetical protein